MRLTYFIIFIVLNLGTSCTRQLHGQYCNKSKLISSVLNIKENKSFSLYTKTKFHGPHDYVQLGEYIVNRNKFYLLIQKEGTNYSTLLTLPETDTIYAYIKSNKVIMYNDNDSIVFKKCYGLF